MKELETNIIKGFDSLAGQIEQEYVGVNYKYNMLVKGLNIFEHSLVSSKYFIELCEKNDINVIEFIKKTKNNTLKKYQDESSTKIVSWN